MTAKVYRWNRPGPTGTALRVLLLLSGAGTLLLDVAAFLYLRRHVFVIDLPDPQSSSTFVPPAWMNNPSAVLWLPSLFSQATMVVWLIWQHQATANLWARRYPNLRTTPGWAVGWWFIPFANFGMPLVAMLEVDRRSTPDGLPRKASPLLAVVVAWLGGSLPVVVGVFTRCSRSSWTGRRRSTSRPRPWTSRRSRGRSHHGSLAGGGRCSAPPPCWPRWSYSASIVRVGDDRGCDEFPASGRRVGPVREPFDVVVRPLAGILVALLALKALVASAVLVWAWRLFLTSLGHTDALPATDRGVMAYVEWVQRYNNPLLTAVIACWLVWRTAVRLRLGSSDPGVAFRWSPTAGVLWWFAPFANLAMPYHVLRELWDAAPAARGPSASGRSYGGGSRGTCSSRSPMASPRGPYRARLLDGGLSEVALLVCVWPAISLVRGLTSSLVGAA